VTDADLVTVAEASARTGVPARTISSWREKTATRPALVQRRGQLVSMDEVQAAMGTVGYKPRKRKKAREKRLTAAEFARRCGVATATVYGWKGANPPLISDYTEAECQRIIRAREEQARGGQSLTEQRRAHVAREETGADVLEIEDDTPAALRREKVVALRSARLEREGNLYHHTVVDGVVRQIATAYRDSLGRAEVRLARVVAAILEEHAISLPDAAATALRHAIQGVTTAEATEPEAAIEAIRAGARERLDRTRRR